MAQYVLLRDGWTLSAPTTDLVPAPVLEAAGQGGIPATTPGCVHTDLVETGLLSGHPSSAWPWPWPWPSREARYLAVERVSIRSR